MRERDAAKERKRNKIPRKKERKKEREREITLIFL